METDVQPRSLPPSISISISIVFPLRPPQPCPHHATNLSRLAASPRPSLLPLAARTMPENASANDTANHHDAHSPSAQPPHPIRLPLPRPASSSATTSPIPPPPRLSNARVDHPKVSTRMIK
ncbi:hypothetical protein CDD80_1733 [Ophiocordyceps camponoti-rufipedis]|uniref:Uncharacterized protein n=1 Tax=Ophiocordyceps camponoti-rufipedis TaxID=2004952 RepID=A0A2C5XYL8_9HYPO|nr:hypothetical protein CDD80_1733 [Ophiocordyceps camponoti-rufipedis]